MSTDQRVLFVRHCHVMNSEPAVLFTSLSGGQWSPSQRAERLLMTLIHVSAHLDLVEVMFGGFQTSDQDFSHFSS